MLLTHTYTQTYTHMHVHTTKHSHTAGMTSCLGYSSMGDRVPLVMMIDWNFENMGRMASEASKHDNCKRVVGVITVREAALV